MMDEVDTGEEDRVADLVMSGEVRFLSPSFRAASDEGGQAFELKFLIAEEQSRDVRSWARAHLLPDPHGDPALCGAYLTHSLYSDTLAGDGYARRAGYQRRKYRVRRYGNADWVSLERKTRVGRRVAKRRVVVQEADLQRLEMESGGNAAPSGDPKTGTNAGGDGWAGSWFARRLRKSKLLPRCQVTYLREAYAGMYEGPVRLTMDREVYGQPQYEWRFVETEAAVPLLPGQVILEFKYRAQLPTIFKQLISDFDLLPAAVSKYRRCRDAWDRQELSRETEDA
jgi:hypothetical protein